MEFGRVKLIDLAKVDFQLPKEPAANKKWLKGKPAKKAKVYVGCAKWGFPEWLGKLYPVKTREKNYLDQYILHYNSVEVNATHYKIIGETGTKKWAEKSKGKDFLFCPKMYQGITHYGKLSKHQFLTAEFLRGIRGFGKHLGPTLIQFNERFSPNRKEELFEFLSKLPKDMEFVLELRHAAWFSISENAELLFKTLEKLKIGAVITDTAGRRDLVHMRLTIPKVFIRFTGNSLHPTDYIRCDEWVKRIKFWLMSGVKEIFFFMHMHDEGTSPELTVYLIDKLNKTCSLNIPRPILIEDAGAITPRKSRGSLNFPPIEGRIRKSK
jgi:uncharacterized protein YecE (DUF72 family)